MSTPRPQKAKKDAQKWPFVRWIESRQRWRVDARTKTGGERRFFPTKSEADGWAQLQRNRKGNEGGSAFRDEELKQFGWTVQRAIDFALEHLRKESASVKIKEGAEALVKFKGGRVGADRLSDIENRLAKFVEYCGERTMRQIDADDVNAFLVTIPHPATRNDYRKEIVMLWHFAKSKPRQWVSDILDKSQVPRAAEPEKARTILTVEQAEALMAASVDDDIRALNALVLFGGVRREEVEKLDWSAINFRTGHIEISAEVSKVSRERFAPIPENLRAWLFPLAEKAKWKGKIVSRNLMHPLRRTWKRAGIYPWPQDAHRHSFISYRRRQIGDAQTAQDAGTSESIIKKHYKRPVTAEGAERYFSIFPLSHRASKKKNANKKREPDNNQPA